MTIVYFNQFIHNSGGMERILAAKTDYLIKKGYDIHIVVLYLSPKQNFFEFNKKISIHYLDIVPKKHFSKDEINSFLHKSEDYLLKVDADIAISMGIDISVNIYKLKDRSKKILETHFTRYKRKTKLGRLAKTKLGQFILPLFFYRKSKKISKFDVYVVLTEEDKCLWPNLKNIIVIPNMITISQPIEKPDYSVKRIIGVGRYTGQKGWDNMIKIWAKINKSYPDWRVDLYGNGAKKDYLQSLINKYGVGDSFTLNPPELNIQREMLCSSILVMTSRYEGQGLVLLESMLCGIPPVAYKCQCGPSEVIEDGVDGFLVPLYAKNRFAEKLSCLMESENLRKKLGEAAIINIKKKYNPEYIIDKWINLFNSLKD